MEERSIGLVLSGGGAKGAYQVGIVKALAEMGIRVSAISGASVGALNGAVLASSVSLKEGAERLETLWQIVAENPPLDENDPTLIRLMEAAGLAVKPTFRNTVIMAKGMRQHVIPTLLAPDREALVDNTPIRKLLERYVTHDSLASGLPLYVSIFPNRNLMESVVDFSLAFFGIKDSPRSEFVHIQSLAEEDQQKALLASAAIPFLLQAQEINGELYSDGGMGGHLTAQGNTPIAPLLDNGYGTVIVTSLSDRSAWNRQQYPNAAIVGIDRVETIDRNFVMPEVFDVISFHPKRIYSWMEQGYNDTMRCVEPKLSALK